jgi:FHS family L-fucose permease-like MFS transporter
MDLSITANSSRSQATRPANNLRLFMFGLFFIFGGITSLNDVLIPKLKSLFALSYAEAMLVQSAFFAAYFIVSLPAAAIVERIGYLRTATLGLLTMMVGCLLFLPASSSGVFAMFLIVLFIVAAGITIVQVVANPVMTMLGDAASASSRLTFAQAFNSLGTTVFPYVGSIVILGSLAKIDPATLSGHALTAFRAAETRVIEHAYLGLAIALLVVALSVWPRFAFGATCIFLYVGAEVAIGSLLVSYLMQPGVMGISAEAAGKHVPYYWGGAMVGRFIGAYFLRICAPAKVLALVAATAIGLLLLSGNLGGNAAGWALLAIGLCNSIMFPTIFSLASEGLRDRTAEGSGIICMAIVGGAIVPVITGRVADLSSLGLALIVPALCYVGILAFGVFAAARPRASTTRL